MTTVSRMCLQMSLLVALAGHPFTAAAQGNNEDRARALFKSAMTSFALGNYDETIEQLSAAYAFYPSPAFLYNLGLTWEKKGSLSRAAEFFRSYLKESGTGNPELEAKIRSMEADVAKATALSSQWIVVRNMETPAASPARSHVAMDVRDWSGVSRKVAGGKYGVWPWVTVATTGAGLITGIVLASVSRSNYNKADDLSHVTNPTQDQASRLSSLKSTIRTQSIVADVSFGIAAAAGVASLVLFLTDNGGDGSDGGPAVELVPAVGSHGESGLAVTGRF